MARLPGPGRILDGLPEDGESFAFLQTAASAIDDYRVGRVRRVRQKRWPADLGPRSFLLDALAWLTSKRPRSASGCLSAFLVEATNQMAKSRTVPEVVYMMGYVLTVALLSWIVRGGAGSPGQ